jgi:UTP--glucose-1-phosphate uridylyltransferase
MSSGDAASSMGSRGHVRKAVVPAAGLGTRFLPATKATPKEMLPVVDKPAIQYVVEEAVTAGLADILFVTGRSKVGLEDHFDRRPYLEDLLAKKGDTERLAEVRDIAALANIHYVRQGEALGLGHAVLQAEMHVGHEAFAVLLGDDLIDARDTVLQRMLEVRNAHGGSVICLMEVPRHQVSLYGCAAVERTDEADLVVVTDLVEKPAAEDAPSNLALIGRYVLDPAAFEVLHRTPPGRGGEIQLTDALLTLARMPASEGGGVRGVVFRGRRYDTGDKMSYLQAVVRIASERPDLGPEFTHWLKGFASELP